MVHVNEFLRQKRAVFELKLGRKYNFIKNNRLEARAWILANIKVSHSSNLVYFEFCCSKAKKRTKIPKFQMQRQGPEIGRFY